MITPEQLAKPDTEHAHQTALFCCIGELLAEHRELRWTHAIPNGGERDRAVASRMKAEGVRAGVWDVLLPLSRRGCSGLYIEMKQRKQATRKNGGLSKLQIDFGNAMIDNGYATAVCYTWEQARDVLLWYLNNVGLGIAPEQFNWKLRLTEDA